MKLYQQLSANRACRSSIVVVAYMGPCYGLSRQTGGCRSTRQFIHDFMKPKYHVSALLVVCVGLMNCSSQRTRSSSENFSPNQAKSTEDELPADHPIRKTFAAMPSNQKLLEDFTARAANNLNTTEAIAWAKEVTKGAMKEGRISSDNIPDTIKMLETRFTAFATWGKNPGESPIFVEWGGGFRHWGLVFAEKEGVLKSFRIIYQPITNGLFTFVSTDQ